VGGVNETAVRRENVRVAVIGMDSCASVSVQGVRFCRLSCVVESLPVHFTGDTVVSDE
jgi:hypothetical protein